tara:strand:+ start:10289 stop:12877 length:2589 start_codon:yes stop_codon:yes gene_type:complete
MARNPNRDIRTRFGTIEDKMRVESSGPFEAIVVNVLDSQYMGRLQVELLKQTDSGNQPETTGQLFEAKYLSPFYNVTSVNASSRNEGYRNSQQSSGFWAVPPDPGTKVLVIFAEGNSSNCYWIGCIQDEYMNFMVPGYAATSTVKDFDKKAPAAEYNKLTTTGVNNEPTAFPKPAHLDLLAGYIKRGLIEDETRGITSSSARREIPSSVFGWSTPGPLDKRDGAPKADIGPRGNKTNWYKSRLGGSSFVMDDGDDKFLRTGKPWEKPLEYINLEAGETGGDPTLPHNELLRLQTRTGHQILLHNTEDLIYIGNSRGTSWIEMTSNGKIDIYAKDSISIHTQEDINFTADNDVNITAGSNLNIVANKIKTSSIDSTNMISGTQWSVNSGQDSSINSNANLVLYAQNNGSIVAGAQQSVMSNENLALGSATGVGIEGCAYVKVTTDGDYDLKTLGNIKILAEGNYDQKSELATRIESANILHAKAVGDLKLRSDANVSNHAGGSLYLYSDGSNIDIQNIIPSTPQSPQEATIPPAPVVVDPTPPEQALTTSRIPSQEPWFEHENYDPVKYSSDNIRAGNTQPETYPPSTPDTFNRGPGGVVRTPGSQPNSYNDTGKVGEGSARFDPTGASDIPEDPPAVKISKQELSRKFASALFAVGFNEQQVYAAIATAETESGLQLKTESGYGGTANDRIRSIFSAARTVSDAELTEIKKDKTLFFELVYGYQSKIGPGMGNKAPGDGGKYIGRGLIQLTGKANYQRYGKLAGLVKDSLISTTNPFGVEIVDDPTILLTDVEKSVAVTAAYLKERYKDFGRGTLGNFRMAIAGTEGGYNLGYPKDQSYLQAKYLPDGTFDPDWIRSPTIGV